MTIYNHHRTTSVSSTVREVVFGMQDGMVSTLGAITGIAIGSHDHFTVILSGMVIVSVESISMGIGSYLSNSSEYDVNQRRIEEEKEEITEFPEQEKKELLQMFIRDGWPEDLAQEMAHAAAKDTTLMLKEMTYRELLITHKPSLAFQNSLFMFFSYILGGLLPLLAYFIFPLQSAMIVSIIVTLIGLFGIGAYTTKYSKAPWLKAGGRVLALGMVAMGVGFLIGELSHFIR